ncbi:MAG: hypothetical protein WC523_04740 [Patescibacteria group bacterium]
MAQKILRRYKADMNLTLIDLGIRVETMSIVEGYETYDIQLHFDDYIYFENLKKISEIFETTNIYFSPSSSGYYGDYTESKLTVVITKDQIDKWFYSVEETDAMDKATIRKCAQETERILKQQARELGYKLVKDEK